MNATYWVLIGIGVAGIVALIPVFFILSKYSTYPYTNARVRAMKSNLVTDDELQGYLKRTYADIIYDIEQHRVPGITEYLGSDFSYAAIDNAMRSHLIADLRKLRRISPEPTKTFIKAFTAKYDVRMIKNLVRKQSMHIANTENIMHVTRVFDVDFVAGEDFSLEAVENQLRGTEYYDAFKTHGEAIRKGDYAAFEHTLNTTYLKKLKHKATTPATKGYVKRNIDRLNTSTYLKDGDTFVEGGRISAEEYNGFKSKKELTQRLREIGVDINGSKNIERALRTDLKKYAEQLLQNEPLSDASTIAYLILQSLSKENLNILLKLKYHEESPEAIQENLYV